MDQTDTRVMEKSDGKIKGRLSICAWADYKPCIRFNSPQMRLMESATGV